MNAAQGDVTGGGQAERKFGTLDSYKYLVSEMSEMLQAFSNFSRRRKRRRMAAFAAVAVLPLALAPDAGAYVLNYVVPDVRQGPAISGGSARPRRMRLAPLFSGIAGRFWATSLGTSPLTIRTLALSGEPRLSEVEASIERAFAAWTSV